MTAACRRTSAKGVVDVIGQSPRDPGGVLAALLSEISLDNLDGLRLTDVPFAPGVSLHLASDVVVLEARLQAQWGRVSPPLWADVWAGGQALARHIARYPNLVAGRTVLDVASGSGLVAITAARAGASQVTANDTDPFALAAIAL